MKQSTEKEEFVYTPEEFCNLLNKSLQGKFTPIEEARILAERKRNREVRDKYFNTLLT